MSTVLEVNRGDYEPWIITWNDADGNPVDLTGAAVELFDNDRCPQFTAQVTNPVLGEITLQPAWPSSNAEILASPQTCFLRIRVTLPSAEPQTTERLTIYVR